MSNDQTIEIRSPYPGLRPFLDTESSIFFGRYSQTVEVIGRLRATHFVAVLGGSGSGKSSLIRAGVIPELRGYGIQEAGDFWVPVLATPGTNLSRRDIPATERETPIDRVARKFVRLLRARSEDEKALWHTEAVNVLRESGGFGGLVNTFSDRLDLPVGPDPQKANFMLVLDQFEELFHPSNKDVPECKTLVDRVLDHFYSPHPRVYLVVTMRSEHLNDCAAFLRLPDAINKASYLVRRLDPSEIDETIEGPPRRYLRMRARASNDRQRFPAHFGFDDAVLKRLRDDVEAIHADPDHLALLQHLLARLWETGCARAQSEGKDIPNRISWADLERAVSAKLDSEAPALPEDVNVLRLCLENWAQTIFDRLDHEDKKHADELLLRLGFKDPNTGMYTQQRLRLDDAIQLVGGSRADPAKVLAGFLPPYDYILWDDENPAQVTIKVFHESFIRGWRHFQELIDREAELFDEFVTLLKETQRWVQKKRPDGLLLEGARLARVREFKLDEVLTDAATRARLLQLLELKRDGERYLIAPADVREFVLTSMATENAEAERAAAEALRTQEIERQQLEAERAAAEQQAENAKLRATHLEQQRQTAETNAKRDRVLLFIAVFFGVVAGVTAVFIFSLKTTADELALEADRSATTAKNSERTAIVATERAQNANEQLSSALEKAKEAEGKAKKAEAVEHLSAKAAEEARKVAVQERNRSSSLRLTFAAKEVVSANLDLALLLTLEAVSVSPSAEAMRILRDAVQSTPVQLTPRTGAGHTGALRGVAVDARNRIATASDDSTVKLWDMVSGKEPQTLRGHGGPVHSVAFSVDGLHVASGSFDDTARLWDATKGTELRKFSGHGDTITSVAFSADGKLLATGSEDRTAKLWETDTGKDLQTFRGHNGKVRGVALSADRKHVATASEDGTAKLWNVTSGKELLNLSGHSRPVTAVAFNHDGTKLATASVDRTVKLWDTQSGKALQTFTGHTNSVLSVAFGGGGKRIATGSVDNTARLWDADSGQSLRTFTGHQDSVTGVALSIDGRLLTGSMDRTARLWELSTETPLLTFGSAIVSQVTAARFSLDASRIVTISGGVAVIWDSLSGSEIRRFSGHGAKLSAIAFSPNGKLLATAGDDKTAKLWDVNDTDKPLRSFGGYASSITAVSFSHDGKRLAVGLKDGTAGISDTESGTQLTTLRGHSVPVLSVAFSPNGRYVATGSYDDTARLWDASSGKALRTLSGHGDTVTSIVFSPDSRRLATGSDDRSAKLWDVETGQELVSMRGHTGIVRNVVFISVGKDVYLGTTSDDRTARLWDTTTGNEERALRGHAGTVQDIVVHPGKKLILTVGSDGALRTHPQTDSDLVELARSRLTRSLSAEECAKFRVTGKSCELANLAAEGKKLFDERKYREAIAIYNKVYALDPKQLSADTWNALCWDASKAELAASVVDGACERAVKLSNGNPNSVDSRGLARALTGRTADAIRDFEVFANDAGSDPEYRNQRRHWITELKVGRNPFTPAMLKVLR